MFVELLPGDGENTPAQCGEPGRSHAIGLEGLSSPIRGQPADIACACLIKPNCFDANAANCDGLSERACVAKTAIERENRSVPSASVHNHQPAFASWQNSQHRQSLLSERTARWSPPPNRGTAAHAVTGTEALPSALAHPPTAAARSSTDAQRRARCRTSPRSGTS